jgi:hypothetical protein
MQLAGWQAGGLEALVHDYALPARLLWMWFMAEGHLFYTAHHGWART